VRATIFVGAAPAPEGRPRTPRSEQRRKNPESLAQLLASQLDLSLSHILAA
jgi:hypothetical protein